MSSPAGLRRLLCLWVLLPLLLGAGPLLLTACNDTVSQLTTTLTALDSGTVKPGDTPGYVVKVQNKGPGSATGVTIHVDLPAGFRFKTTTGISGDGARTQPADPVVNSASPEWGLWSLGPPTADSTGSPVYSQIAVSFAVDSEGSPGTYSLTARSSGDATQGDAQPPTVSVQMLSAPRLSLSVTAEPTSAHINDLVTYKVTVTNDGSGDASGTQVLVSLPDGFSYSDTVKIEGNSSRAGAVDPARQAALAYFDGFTIPAHASSGPGLLVITLRARILHGVAAGSYSVSAQVTDDGGDQVMVSNAVPVTVS